jgi:DNA-binding response OmpR family regulator
VSVPGTAAPPNVAGADAQHAPPVAPFGDLPDSARMGSIQQPRILDVDDEAPILDLVRGYLEREGFAVSTAADGPAGLDAVRAGNPDVVILDVMLPGLDGIEVCRQLRTFSSAYVLMLTARGEEIDRIMGLTVGADDYLVKPFSPRELVARVKALLRRPRVEASPAAAGPPGLEIDEAKRSVRVDDRAVDLTTLEFDLLAALARDPGVVIRRQALLDRVWGIDFVADDHLVDVHIANLRRKLGDDPAQPRFVETVRGVGYRLRDAG